jgi:hypothetical protein
MLYFLIEAVECGVKVMWDGRHMGVVAVPRPDHLGHLSGMCGDCDRNKDNDLTTKDGQNVNICEIVDHQFKISFHNRTIEHIYYIDLWYTCVYLLNLESVIS